MPFEENAIAQNPDTGDEIIFRGGKWHPLPKVGGPLGTAPPATAAPAEPEVGALEDIKKTALPSLARGTVGALTTPSSMRELAGKGMQWLADKTLPEDVSSGVEKARGMLGHVASQLPMTKPFMAPTYNEAMEKVQEKTGPLYEAQTTPGKFAQTGLEFLPSAVAGPGSMAGKVARGAGAAIGSETAGQLTPEDAEIGGVPLEPVTRTMGALFGSHLPNTARRIRTPFPTTPERTAQADLLRSQGVDVTAGQATGSPFLQGVEGLAANKAPAWTRPENQATQITRGAMRTMGSDASHADPMNVGTRGIRLGETVEDITGRNMLRYDPEMAVRNGEAVGQLRREARIPRGQPTGLESELNQIERTSGGHVRMGMNGPEYQQLRSDMSARAQDLAQSGNPTDRALSRAMKGVRDSLDGAMARSTAGTPDEGAFQRFREQWAAYKAIKKVVDAGGDAVAAGNLSPSALYSAVRPELKTSPLGMFSRAAQNVAKPIQQHSSQLLDAPPLVAAVLGGLAGHYLHAPAGGAETAVLGLLAGHHAPKNIAGLLAPLMYSRPAQRYLRNQRSLPNNNSLDPQQVARMLAAQGTRQIPPE